MPPSTTKPNGPTLTVRVLTTAAATARQENMAGILSRARGLDQATWSFFQAIPLEEAGLRYDDAAAHAAQARTLSPAELSCFASHYAILRDWLSAGSSDHLLVLEDDILIDPWFNFLEAARLMEAAGLDYLRLYGRAIVPVRTLAYPARHQVLRLPWSPGGMQAYMLSRDGARRVVAMVDAAEHVVRPIDDQLDRFWETGNPVYALHPWPVLEQSMPTCIHTDEQMRLRKEAQQRLEQSSPQGWRHGLTRRLGPLRERLTRKAVEGRLQKTDAAVADRLQAFFRSPGFGHFKAG